MEFLVIYERAEHGSIWARVPDLSGCCSMGATIREAKANVKEAIELYLETAREEGMIIPEPHHIKGELLKVA